MRQTERGAIVLAFGVLYLVREKPPVTEKPPKKGATMLAKPMPNSSWLESSGSGDVYL